MGFVNEAGDLLALGKRRPRPFERYAQGAADRIFLCEHF
jgi:hypothetical protein